MKWIGIVCMAAAFSLQGCADEESTQDPQPVADVSEEVVVPTDYTDWSADQSGTTAKPAYGKACRYRASEESVWELAADGADDHLSVVGPSAGEVSLHLEARAAGAVSMGADVVLSRVLSGKAYYEATGTMSFDDDAGQSWSVLDGTLCFASTVVGTTSPVPGEFSLIAQRDMDGEIRTVGGTFTLPADKMSPDSDLNISDDAIALDLR
jgi:hypothetical protein